MDSKSFFQRREIKYLLDRKQVNELKSIMKDHMEADEFGFSTIHSIYYDTPNKRLIRASLDKPLYREKLRIRSYGKANDDDIVYVEIKKKFKKVVYKRREKMKSSQAREFFDTKKDKNCIEEKNNGRFDYIDKSSQVLKELKYFKVNYGELIPSAFISYDREAYFGKNDDSFRMTFDEDICFRDYDFDFSKGAYGHQLLPEGKILLEVKTMEGLPFWLLRFLDENNLRKANFSKYGLGYTRYMLDKIFREDENNETYEDRSDGLTKIPILSKNAINAINKDKEGLVGERYVI